MGGWGLERADEGRKMQVSSLIPWQLLGMAGGQNKSVLVLEPVESQGGWMVARKRGTSTCHLSKTTFFAVTPELWERMANMTRVLRRVFVLLGHCRRPVLLFSHNSTVQYICVSFGSSQYLPKLAAAKRPILDRSSAILVAV